MTLAELALLLQIAALSPDTILLKDEVVCRQCRIALRDVARLYPTRGHRIQLGQLSLAVDGRGSLYATGMTKQGGILKFSPVGGRVQVLAPPAVLREQREQRVVVRAVAVGTADTLYALDPEERRLLRFSPSGVYLDPIPLGPLEAETVIARGDGTLILAGVSRTRSEMGYLLHAWRPGRSGPIPFGASEDVVRPDQSASQRRLIAAAAASEVVSARINQYELRILDSAGRTKRVLIRKPTWFAPWTAQPPLLTAPPNPVVAGILVDDLARIWVSVLVPSPSFQPTRQGAPTASPSLGDTSHGRVRTDERTFPYLRYLRSFETIVEVIDPRQGVIVARARLPAQLILSTTWPFSFEVLGPDEPRLHVQVKRMELDIDGNTSGDSRSPT